MRRILTFSVILAAGMITSAWMGKTDAAVMRRSGGVLAARSLDRGVSATPDPPPRNGEWRGGAPKPDRNSGPPFRDSGNGGGEGLLIQPVGSFPRDRALAIGHMMEVMRAFLGVSVQCAPPIPIGDLPPRCFGTSGGIGRLNAGALLDRVLETEGGGGAAAVVAVTSLDLGPDEKQPPENAFDRPSPRAGAAVLSIGGVIDGGRADRGQNLLRMMKRGVHEALHAFSLKHCAKYACLMNSCRDARECDAMPLALCPDCIGKLSFVTGLESRRHVDDMLALCRARGFLPEAEYYSRLGREMK